MAKKKAEETSEVTMPAAPGAQELINALVQAIQITKPIEKKTFVTRKPGSPWDPKDGSKKLKLKRKMYQHGLTMDPDFLTNEEISLCNNLKTGKFLDGWVKVYKRKDGGVDIDYPVKTASQRMKLVSTFGVRNLADLLSRCIEEAKNPKPELPTDDDL